MAGGTYSLLDLSMFECCLLSSRCSLWLELTIRTNGFRSVPSWDCEWVGVENPGQVRKREIFSFVLQAIWISSHCADASLDYER